MQLRFTLAQTTYSGSDLTLDVVARLPLPRTTLFTSPSSLLSRVLCGVLRVKKKGSNVGSRERRVALLCR